MSLTRMILVIFTFFLISYLPLMIVNVFDDEESVPFLHVFASILAWSASVINPIVYAVLNRRYRAAFASVFVPLARLKCSNNGHRRNLDFHRLYYAYIMRNPMDNYYEHSAFDTGLSLPGSISYSVTV